MIKVILWDIDGTLLNFQEAEKQAIRKCFALFNLGECTDEMLARYSAINVKYWQKLERRELTKQEVLIGRYEEFFQKEKMNFTEVSAFNEAYQHCLGDTICFNDNSYELVRKLKSCVKQYAVTNGTLIAQEKKLKKSGLDKLFDDVFISEQIGADKPNVAFFETVWDKIGEYKKDEVMIVGDSLTSDMQGGINAGIICCWYNPKQTPRKAGMDIEYEIQDLWQIEEILVDRKEKSE